MFRRAKIESLRVAGDSFLEILHPPAAQIG
jgi:hypothetical protein